jgi:hypothetical protein
MLRDSAALVAALMLIVIGTSPAKARPKCYNSQACFTDCMKSGIGRKCEKQCSREASMLPPCK